MIDVKPTWLKKLEEKCEKEPDRFHIVFLDEITNALLSIQGIAFNIVLDREVNGENDTDKDSRLDFLGVCSDGTKINVEIQVAKLEEMGRRSLFYWCRIYNDLEAGQDYGELKRTVAINLLDFNLFSKNDCPHYHNCYGLYNSKNYHKLTSDLEMYFIEIPKWKLDIMKKIDDKGKDKPQNIVDAEKVKAMKRLDKWVRGLR